MPGDNPQRYGLMEAKLKRAIAREGLIFVALFGVSYIVYLIVRITKWRVKRLKITLTPKTLKNFKTV